ncbi:MAG: hypothetical protein LIO79_00900 [Rikenellaceae bacterium]|nr:hypothetical protein [Rikenellaceae bacterium]
MSLLRPLHFNQYRACHPYSFEAFDITWPADREVGLAAVPLDLIVINEISKGYNVNGGRPAL